MAGEVLAQIACDACGTTANIKKLKNSPLLYLHCPNCGMDRRSGAAVQQKWQAAIDGDGPEQAPEPAGDEIHGEPETPKDYAIEQDWKPTPETHRNPEAAPDNSGDEAGAIKKKPLKAIACGALFLLALGGIVFNSVKGRG